jgi:2-polyprenyl-6-methoxyphenol hydroxylase-like FAD-dependent oxidoreductase
MSATLLSDSVSPRPHSVAVIGAGTAGMAAALFLVRAGHHVTLFERVPTPGPVGAGLLLQPTGLFVLEKLGLAAQIRASGARVERLLGTTPRGRTVMDLRYADVEPDMHGVGIHRGSLSDTLWEAVRAAGVTLRLGATVDLVEQLDERVRIRQGSARDVEEFDLAVIADGTFSQLRSQIAIPHEISVYPWGAWWAILRDPDQRYQGVLRQVYRRAAQMLGVMPVGRLPAPATDTAPHVTLFWSVRRADEAPLRAKGLQAWKDAVLELAPEVEPLTSQITDSDQLIFATYADVRMAPWHHRRVVVIGDAAHATSPQLGQGANLALIDALVLSRCLAVDTDVVAALAAYTAARRAHLDYYQWASSLLTPVFQSDARLLPFLRNVFMPLACHMPGMRGQMLSALTGRKAGLLWGQLNLE